MYKFQRIIIHLAMRCEYLGRIQLSPLVTNDVLRIKYGATKHNHLEQFLLSYLSNDRAMRAVTAVVLNSG